MSKTLTNWTATYVDGEHHTPAGTYSGDLRDLEAVAQRFGLQIEDHEFDPFTGAHYYSDADGQTVLVIETA